MHCSERPRGLQHLPVHTVTAPSVAPMTWHAAPPAGLVPPAVPCKRGATPLASGEACCAGAGHAHGGRRSGRAAGQRRPDRPVGHPVPRSLPQSPRRILSARARLPAPVHASLRPNLPTKPTGRSLALLAGPWGWWLTVACSCPAPHRACSTSTGRHPGGNRSARGRAVCAAYAAHSLFTGGQAVRPRPWMRRLTARESQRQEC